MPDIVSYAGDKRLFQDWQLLRVMIRREYTPVSHYVTRPGLIVWGGFETYVSSVAKPRLPGVFVPAVSSHLEQLTNDVRIEQAVGSFGESELCALLAAMLDEQCMGTSGNLEHTGRINLFYAPLGVVGVRRIRDADSWGIAVYKRNDGNWYPGVRVFAPQAK